MSLCVVCRRPHHSLSKPGRAGIVGTAIPDKARHEHRLQWLRRHEQQVDEELAQSFPANGPPSWMHGTEPPRQ